MFIFLLFLQFNFITFFQACLIAFTSEFIPKLVYKYEHSWEMKGYVNFTLATSPYQGWGEVGKTECRYRAFRDHEGSFTPSHYKILGLKLAFVIIFEVSRYQRSSIYERSAITESQGLLSSLKQQNSPPTQQLKTTKFATFGIIINF